jgi:hypothetical protein
MAQRTAVNDAAMENATYHALGGFSVSTIRQTFSVMLA